MEVILLESVRRLGTAGSKVKVKDGYGRNYLIPYHKAIRSTKENLALFEQQKAIIAQNNQEKLLEASVRAKAYESLNIEITRQAAEDGRLFGSVGAKDIVLAINEKGLGELDRSVIMLNKPIKSIGEHVILISLHPEVNFNITVNVVRSNDR